MGLRMQPDEIAELRKQKYNATVAHLHKGHGDLMLLRHQTRSAAAAAQGRAVHGSRVRFLGTAHAGVSGGTAHPRGRATPGAAFVFDQLSILDDNGALLAAQDQWLEFYIVLVRDTGQPKAPA